MNERRHHGQHENCDPCRWLSVGIAPSAMPSRRNENPVRESSTDTNSWERGIVRHASGMPFLDSKLDPIGVHEWQSIGHRYMKDFNAAVSAGTSPAGTRSA